ncbi:unnamed protein product [Caenorhabditis brenneri]
MFILNIIPFLLLIVTTNAIGLPDDIAYSDSRFERATDEEFSTAIKQMEMISRITNGISLRQGLSRGSITNEELISELLNLRDMEPSDIERIDTEELKKLIKSIQTLGTIHGSQKTDTIEKRLDKLSSVAEKFPAVKKLEKPGKAFFTAVSKIRDSKKTWDEFNAFASGLSSFWKSASKVANADISKLTNDEITRICSTLETDIKIVKKKKIVKTLENELATNVMQETKQQLEPFTAVSATVEEFAKVQNDISYSNTDDKAIESLKNNIKTLAVVIDHAWENLETIQILETLYLFRLHRKGNHDMKLIPGFWTDPSELALIFNDLKDSWLQTEVKGQASNLEKALQPLNTLKEKTEALERSFRIQSDQSFTEISLISKQVKYLSHFHQIDGASPDTLKNVLQSSNNAKGFLPSNRDKVKNLYKNMVDFCDHFPIFKEVFKIWQTFSQQDTIDQINKVLALVSADDGGKPKEHLKKLKGDKNFINIWKIMNDNEKHIELAQGTFDITATAKSIADGSKELDDYLKKVNNFLNTIEPMKGFSGLKNPKAVFENIKTIDAAITDNTFGGKANIDIVIGTIGNTKSALKELDDTINSMKQAKGSEIDGLVGMTDATESARNIGSATKAISSMNKFLGLDTKKLDAAVKELQKKLNDQASIESQKTLKTLASLEIQIQNFKQEITSFKKSVQPITSSKLSDYSEIFEKAKSVKGIARDLLALSVSVGKLEKDFSSDKKTIDEIKDLLVNMDKLCLRYSKYQRVFDGSKNTLNNIDLLFTNLKTAPTVKNTATSTEKNAYIYDDSRSGKKVESATWSPQMRPYYEIGYAAGPYALVIFILIVILVSIPEIKGLIALRKKLKEERKKEEEKMKMKKAEEVPETTITPAPPSTSNTPAATATPKKT